MGTLYKESNRGLPGAYPLKGRNDESGVQIRDNFLNDALNNDDRRHEDINENHSTEKKVSKRAKWKKVWFDFSQATTLHGINKITEDTPFTARR